MAVLVMRNFGGMAPSANPKLLPDGGAAYCRNLDLRYGDFRPLPGAANAATIAAGSTLYKFETTGGFITRTAVVNFVRGPIATDTTERTYYTGDGVPQVTDNTGDTRQLGVPKPAAAPTVAVNATSQYSKDDAAAAQQSKLAEMTSTINAHLVQTYVGLTDTDLASDFVAGPGDAPWLYYFKIDGTLSGGVFSPTNANHRALMTDRLGFHIDTVAGVTTGYANLEVRGAQLAFDANLSSALAAITGATGSGTLLSSDQVSAITADLTDGLKAADAARDAAIVRLRAIKEEFVRVADSGSVAIAANYSAVQNFYASANVSQAVNEAVTRCANAIKSMMNAYNRN